ncbi:MAG: hypothetical protein C0390_06935 [Syntrophus sp. (in: bacteria)]|nr:hypothetical protein [Syntrophus sp. (in: bacteria)]
MKIKDEAERRCSSPGGPLFFTGISWASSILCYEIDPERGDAEGEKRQQGCAPDPFRDSHHAL